MCNTRLKRICMTSANRLATSAFSSTLILLLPQLASAQDSTKSTASSLEEIVVTATKREESMQKVSVAVSALSGEDIENAHVQGFSDVVSMMAGPTFVPVSGASGSQISMRGQYTADDSPAFDMPVGVFIDDIYYGSIASFYPDFFDLQQVAVLRGPQGTTFGRNTVGGALQVVSAKPNFNALSGAMSLTLRNPAGFETTGHINAPLSETVATRFAYSIKDYDGYRRNVTTGNDLNDKNVKSARGSIRLKPNDSLDVLATASYTKDKSLGDGPMLVGQGALIASIDAQRTNQNQTFVDDDGLTDREMKSALVRADWSLPFATFTSITGYRGLDALYREDIDGSPVPIAPNKFDINEETQYSQEFRLTSPSGQTVEWIAGLYYLHQETFRSENYTFGGLAPWRIHTLAGNTQNVVRIAGDVTTESYAPFGEVKWHLTDRWALAGGIRYTHDSKENLTVQENVSNPGASTVFFGLPKSVAASDTWTAWTPRVGIEFQPTEDAFLYLNVARGYKSGGYNYAATTVAQAATPILPEKTLSYELGAKTDWFDHRLRANLAVYQTTTEDLQVRSLVGTVFQSSNAGEAETKGAELELLANPIGGFTMGANYAYTDAKFTSYETCAGTAAAPVSCTGNPIPFVPKNSYNLWLQNAWTFDNGSSVTFRVEDSWADAVEVHIGAGTRGAPTAAQPAGAFVGPQLPRAMTRKDGIMNAFLTYEAPGAQWSLQGWSKNVLNKQYATFATNYFFYLLTNTEATTGNLYEADRLSVNAARSYGLTFNYRFE
jgi:iron complex outermembrane receptor protein